MSVQTESLLYLCTHGPEDPEKATLPFAMALGAQATDRRATVVLQGGAVLLGVKGEAGHVFARGMAPLKEQLDEFLSGGGRLLACSACLTARQVDESSILDRVEIVSVTRLNNEFADAAAVVCY